MEQLHFDIGQVLKKLRELKPSKAAGPDGLHPKMLRELATSLATPLTTIYETSLRTMTVPADWKSANISAIHKKGARTSPGNYRPVSLTSVLCKVMEKFVRDSLLQHLENNNILSEQQFGFLSGRSTALQLLRVLDEWTEVLDRGGEVDVIYMDFKKAFDSVPHKRLMAKLKGYGVTDPMLGWIQSFLSERTQSVVVGSSRSTPRPVTSGIPQGSVLGPVLFVIYINDLPLAVKSRLFLFADDAKIYRPIVTTDDRAVLQQDLRSMGGWSLIWLLIYHPEKCKSMTVSNDGGTREEAIYQLGDTVLQQTTSEKDLGVTIDSTLSFDTHITAAVNKANRVMGVIRRTFKHLDAETFKLLYKSLVRPHLEYAHSAWKPHLRKHIDLIESVQRRGTRQIPGLSHLSYPERLQLLGLPTLAYRRLRGDMIETFKIARGYYNNSACGTLLHYSHNTRTRGHSLKLETRACRSGTRDSISTQSGSSRCGMHSLSPWYRLPASTPSSAA